MAGNEQLIDQVIAPVADEQVITLTRLLADLDIQMVKNIQTTNLYNAATSNSKTFAEYNKNATATALGLEKIQQQQNRTAQTTIALNETLSKTAAAEQARQDKALLALQRKQAAQAAADAKEIAQAEAKAAKLAQIQAKQNTTLVNEPPQKESFADVQAFLNSERQNTPQIIPVSSSESGQPIENLLGKKTALAELNQQLLAGTLTVEQYNAKLIEAGLSTKVVSENATKTTAAVTTETAAMTQQSEVLATLSTAYRANIELLLALQAEQTENAVELKTLNADNAEAGERAIFLTSQQLRLKVAIADVNTKLASQTKELGGFNTGMSLADKVSNQFVRTLIRMSVYFVLIGVAFKAVEWLYDYIKALDIFNPIATEAEMRQKALVEAFASADYQKGIEGIINLGAELDLVKKGVIDQDVAINKYNETLGKTFGAVNNINDAQKGFIANKDAYIAAIIDEAVAQLLAADAAKQVAEESGKIQKAQQEIIDAQNEIDSMRKSGISTRATEVALLQLKGDIKDANADIDRAKDRQKQIIANATKGIEGLDTDQTKKTGKKTLDNSDKDAAAELANSIMNQALERQKITAQTIIGNEKLSYKQRLDAVKAFADASAQIEKNNETTKINELPKGDAKIAEIQSEAATKLLEIEKNRIKQTQDLNEKAYKQDQEHLKNNIEKQRDIFKGILDDENASYDLKLISLDIYNKKTDQLNKANFAEQVKEAGKNSKALTLAQDEFDKADLERKNYVASETLKIKKDNLQKILEVSKESEEDQLETLKNGSNLAAKALSDAHEDAVTKLDDLRKKQKINEKKYNQDLLDLNDQYAIDRIAQEIATQQAILATKEGNRDATITRMRGDNESPEEISKFTSNANKGIQGTKDTISSLGVDLNRAVTKKKNDDTGAAAKAAAEEKKAIEQAAYDVTVAGIDQVNKLRQQAFENEIVRLKKLGDQIDENANNEKLQVQNSIASSATKAREIAVIDAQTASAKKALQVEENKEKTKEAKADKEATIAKLIAQGALAVVTALTGGPIIGEIQAIATAAVVAVELATAIATPLPTYATGTDNYPGGLGLWGEAGTELATLPSGKKLLSTGPEIMNFPKGTTIMPHMQLMQMIRPEVINYVGGQEIGWEQVIKQLKKMEPKRERQHLIVNVDNGFENYKKSYLRR